MKIRVAIDPDVTFNGVVTLYEDSPELDIRSLTFFELIEYLKQLKQDDNEVSVIVESGYLNKAHWHNAYKLGARVSARIGNKTGSNHQVSKLITEAVDYYKIGQTYNVKPLKKMWRGKDGKITHDELVLVCKSNKYVINKKRTNQEERDAVLLCICHNV